MSNRRIATKKIGYAPGLLTWAWLSLIAALGIGYLWVEVISKPIEAENIVKITLADEPERFAPIDPEALATYMEAAKTAIKSGQDVEGGSPGTLPEILAPDLPEAPGEAETIASEGDTAQVIRLEDLPAPGEEPAIDLATIEVIGSPPPALDNALITKTPDGLYPQVALDGRVAATYYRRGFSDPADRPKVAVIVAGLGLSTSLTTQAINDLPPEITLAFAPYARDLPQWTAKARNAGHELMLELPMEATGLAPEALGPAALLTSRTDLENKQRLDWLLSRFEGYFGVTNYLGSRLSNSASIEPILEQVEQAGVAFISDTEIEGAYLQATIAYTAQANYLLSNRINEPMTQLERIEKQLLEQETAILIKIYPTPQSLTQLSLWAKSLKEKGIALAPASSMLQ